MFNYAQLLAQEGLHFSDPKALEYEFYLFEDLYYRIYSISADLAQERGSFSTFKESKWAQGQTPYSLSISPFKNKFETQYDWDMLGEKVKRGVRFSLHAAIAPTATSAASLNATESTEPITELFYIQEGTQTLPAIVPNVKKNREFYDICWDVSPKTIIEHASIRQMFVDQAQSINLYYIKPESAKELAEDIFYAMDLGIKTLYYMKTPKSGYREEACESCSV